MTLRSVRACIAGLVALPVLSIVAPAPVDAAGTYCGLSSTPGLTTFTWTGAAGDSLWKTGGNWSGGIAPNLNNAANGYVCIDAANDVDTTSDTVYLVAASANVDTTSQDASAMLQAIDVATGTLSINRAGKLYLHGDQVSRPSVVRPGARLELTMGTVGGSGLLDVQGDMVWTAAQAGSSTLKSSCRGIADDGPGSPAGPIDTLPQFCPPAVDPVGGVGRLVVGGSLTIRGGSLDSSGVLVDDGRARGVSLAQRYRLEVASGGEVHVAGNAYLAQSHTTAIEVRAGGSWTFDGDGDVLEGFFEGTPSGPLPPFVNDGTVTKAGGGGASSIDTAYSGAGEVVVQDGALTTPGGFPRAVSVAAGESVGTWGCPQVVFGAVAGDCTFDSPDDASLTDSQDRQAAAVELPPTSAARVEVRETTDQGPDDLQPQIVIASDDLVADEQAELKFEFNASINLPARADISIYRKAGAANWRRVPRCSHAAGSPLPRAVTACVRIEPRDRARGNGVLVTVETKRVRGRWVLRKQKALTGETLNRVVPADNGTFAYLDRTAAPLRTLTVTSAGSTGFCGTAQTGAWDLHRVLEDPITDDHSVGWHRAGAGEARGFTAPVGDLADVDEFAGSLRVESGVLRGFARLARYESAAVSWQAFGEVTLADTDATGTGAWRLANGTGYTYRWQRYVNGVRDSTPAVDATLEDFLADHADKASGTEADRIGFAYGCAGEDVQVNELIVRKVVQNAANPTRTVVWDLEAPIGLAEITPRADIGATCQLARPTWPNVAYQGVTASVGAAWVLEWAPAASGPWVPLRMPNRRTAAGVGSVGRIPLVLPGRGGLIRVRVPTTDDNRKSVGRIKRFKAVPAIDLRKITRRLRVGQTVKLQGVIRPASARNLQLWVARPGTRRLQSVTARITVDRRGAFVARFKAPSKGRFALTVRYVARSGGPLTSALAREVFFTTVRPKPKPRPDPEPVPEPPAPVAPPPQDTGEIADGDLGVLDPVERSARAQAATCVYTVGR